MEVRQSMIHIMHLRRIGLFTLAAGLACIAHDIIKAPTCLAQEILAASPSSPSDLMAASKTTFEHVVDSNRRIEVAREWYKYYEQSQPASSAADLHKHTKVVWYFDSKNHIRLNTRFPERSIDLGYYETGMSSDRIPSIDDLRNAKMPYLVKDVRFIDDEWIILISTDKLILATNTGAAGRELFWRGGGRCLDSDVFPISKFEISGNAQDDTLQIRAFSKPTGRRLGDPEQVVYYVRLVKSLGASKSPHMLIFIRVPKGFRDWERSLAGEVTERWTPFLIPTRDQEPYAFENSTYYFSGYEDNIVTIVTCKLDMEKSTTTEILQVVRPQFNSKPDR